MENSNFPRLVRKYFSYLENTYGFHSVNEHMYGSEPFSDGIIEFQSATTVVTVQKDRWDVFVNIRPSSEPEIAELSINIIVDFLTNEKEIYLEKYPKAPSSIETRVDYQLITYAELLKKYGVPLLRGDFSWWLDACKYFLKRMQDHYRSHTGKELPENERFTMYVKSKEDNLSSG